MKNIKSLLIFTILFSIAAHADRPLTERQRLSKLSSILRFGMTPDTQDQQAIVAATTPEAKEAAFQQITQRYLGSNKFVESMVYRLEELYRLKSTPSMLFPTTSDERYELRHGSLNELFVQVVRDNRSWDDFLTGRVYKSFQSSGLELNDHRFYAGVDTVLRQRVTPESQIFNDDFQNRIIRSVTVDLTSQPAISAGVLTTPRFIKRYTNTNLNKGRRRAAAIFRIFLCDAMAAAIPPSTTDSRRDTMNRLFPTAGQQTGAAITEQASQAINMDQHGQRADCRACHYKLDPAGQTLSTTGIALSQFAVPGALAYRSSGGQDINIAVNGVGQLGEALVAQDDYVACQVQHFWKWFIGANIPLSASRKAELVQEFNRVGRRTKDFVAVMVSTPEFRTQFAQDEVRDTIQAVQGIFQRCDSCHLPISRTQHPYGLLPEVSFTQFPIGGNAQSHEELVNFIKVALDVQNNFANPEMPPRRSGITLTDAEKQIVKRWFDMGAPATSSSAVSGGSR